MKCARINLKERPKFTVKLGRSVTQEQPRRYCQKRLVNPDHDEDPRWMDVLQRFHCNGFEYQDINDSFNEDTHEENSEDLLFLSVQNLKFLGDEQKRKRPRTSFKYKKVTGGYRHRMFVKQAVEDPEYSDDDCSSQLTCYYFEDYAKYIHNADKSRPSSGKSSIVPQTLTKSKENKAVQVDIKTSASKKTGITITVPKIKQAPKIDITEMKNEVKDEPDVNDTKISFHKSGKRKSLTISRAPSPETVQVIRVDVVCNYYSNSTLSDYEDTKKGSQTDSDKQIISKIENMNLRNNHYANKYLLTNTVKSLDEKVACGKVTLLCKTFKLSDRARVGKKTNNNLGKQKLN